MTIPSNDKKGSLERKNDKKGNSGIVIVIYLLMMMIWIGLSACHFHLLSEQNIELTLIVIFHSAEARWHTARRQNPPSHWHICSTRDHGGTFFSPSCLPDRKRGKRVARSTWSNQASRQSEKEEREPVRTMFRETQDSQGL